MQNAHMHCLAPQEVHAFAQRVLLKLGLSARHADAIAEVVTAGQLDECKSHGLYRILAVARTLRLGQVSPDAEPVVQDVSESIVRVDACFAFQPLAFQVGSALLVEKTRRVGLAALVINNCHHFSALWVEVERLATHGLAALAMTPSHAWVAPAGGQRPVLGTNPIAFAWPRSGQHPYVFDLATSAAARGDIELHHRRGEAVPHDWGIDAQGQATTDPNDILTGGAMLTFGGYKGSAIATMVELLAGPLLGDLTSLDASAKDGSRRGTPCHGELVIAFDPNRFSHGDPITDGARAERLFAAITGQGARLPSERRFAARARSARQGAQVRDDLYQEILGLLA